MQPWQEYQDFPNNFMPLNLSCFFKRFFYVKRINGYAFLLGNYKNNEYLVVSKSNVFFVE